MMTNATSVVCKILNYYMKISLQQEKEEDEEKRAKLKDPSIAPEFSPPSSQAWPI